MTHAGSTFRSARTVSDKCGLGWFPDVAGSLLILELDFPFPVILCPHTAVDSLPVSVSVLSSALFLGQTHQDNLFAPHPPPAIG